MRSPCGSGPANTISHGEQVMYGWGRDAPGMHLPQGAGFSVGPRTGIRMAVLQVRAGIGLTGNSAPKIRSCRLQSDASRDAGTELRRVPRDIYTLLTQSTHTCRCTTRLCGRRGTTPGCASS